MEPTSVPACLNCDAPLAGEYCSSCGQRAIRGRLQAGDLVREALGRAIDLDAALPRTIVDLTLRPGRALRDWVAGRRKRYVGPTQYFAFAVAVLFLVFAVRHVRPSDLGHYRAGAQEYPEAQDAIEEVMRLLDRHLQYLIFAMIPFFASAAGFAYRTCDVTPPERWVVFTYVVAHASLLGSIPRLAIGVGSAPLNASLAVAGLAYYAWATRGFFGGGWVRAILTITLGYAALLVATVVTLGVVLGVAIVSSTS